MMTSVRSGLWHTGRSGDRLLAGAPLVSIVLPTYDRLDCLRATLQSVFRQTMQDWELIVADDGSGPDVLEFLQELHDGERVRVLPLPHSGNPGKARNVALAAARGPYVAFLDSDDLWEAGKLEIQLAALRADRACQWSYTGFTIVDADGCALVSERDRPWTPHGGQIFEAVVRGTASIRTPAVLARTRFVMGAGAFDEQIDCGEDYDLWMRLALLSPACVVDTSLVRVRRHAGNRTWEVSRPYAARDYSLRKLAQCTSGARRALLDEERSRNALALAAETARAHGRWRALAVIGRSLPYCWRYPRWWLGGAKAVARAFGVRRATGARPRTVDS